MVRASACHAEGREFESRHSRQLNFSIFRHCEDRRGFESSQFFLAILNHVKCFYGTVLIVYLSLSSNIHIPSFGAGGEIGGSDIRVDFVERVF